MKEILAKKKKKVIRGAKNRANVYIIFYSER